jgi:hypothetical protein
MIIFKFHRQPYRLVLPLSLTCLALAAGCGPQEEIRTYPVAKEAQVPVPEPRQAADSGQPTHRMMGAILPAGEGAWFFKVVGPMAAIDQREGSINEFFNSIRVTPGAAQPEWMLPEGWTEQGASGMRAATLLIPADGKPMELTVMRASGDVLSNVNRWRGQMKLPEVDQKGLVESTSERKVGEATMTLVDLRGRFEPGMMAPFASGATGSAARRSEPNQESALPAGHPPIDAASAAQGDAAGAAAVEGAPTFDAPASWRALPAGEFGKAAFVVSEGAKTARVTVSDFRKDAGPMIGDVLQNVNRWRQIVGLGPVDKDALASVTESIEIDGKPATYTSIIPDPSKPAESQIELATLAAMVPDGERIWFFKIIGDRQLVAQREDEFKNFLKSVRLAAGDGASDGD